MYSTQALIYCSHYTCIVSMQTCTFILLAFSMPLSAHFALANIWLSLLHSVQHGCQPFNLHNFSCRKFANVTLNSSSSCRAKCPSVRLPCHCGRASLPPPLSLQSGWKRRRSSSPHLQCCLLLTMVRKMGWLNVSSPCRVTQRAKRTRCNC